MSSSRESSGFPPWEYSWPLFRHLFLFKLYYEYSIHVPLDIHWLMLFSLLFYCMPPGKIYEFSLDTFRGPLQIHTSSFPFLLCPGGCPLLIAPMGSFAPAFCFGGHCEEWEMSEMIIIPSLLCCHPFMVQWAVTVFTASPRFLLGSPLQ